MHALLSVLGVAVVVAVVVDVVTTTVAVGSGAGPLTQRVSEGIWRLARRMWAGNHRALHRAGLAVLLVSIMLWVLLAWAGWSLVFAGAEGAVVAAATEEPGGVWDRVYFAGFTLLTLGVGDFRPGGAVWQIATVLAVANGFMLITLAITYVVPVVSAATQKRQMASYLATLGSSPQQLLARAYDGKGFGALDDRLADLPQQLLLYVERHHSYPVLHYFHSMDPATAAPLQLAIVDEGLTLLDATRQEDPPDDVAVPRLLRSAMTRYLQTLAETYAQLAPAPPPPPSLDELRARGIPTVDGDVLASKLAAVAERRRLLRGVVEHDGWTWDDVCPSTSDGGDDARQTGMDNL